MRGSTLAKIAPNTLIPIQVTQVQNRKPRRFLRAGAVWTVDSSTISAAKVGLLTTDPRVDDVDGGVKGEVNHDDPHRHDENNALDDQVVTASDGGDELVAEPGDGEQVLHDDSPCQETSDVDARRTQQGDR